MIKEINRLRKERNRLLIKGMSNIYLKVTIETFSKLRFSGFKKFATGSLFGVLQLSQISLNFQTSSCNLKIRALGAKLCVAFLLFWFWKELWRFKVKESMNFVEQQQTFIKKKQIPKWKLTHTFFRETKHVLHLI